MFKINKTNNNRQISKNIFLNNGFTLVEMLIAFAIITVSTVAIFSLIIQNIQVQGVNKDLFTASMLAQEGLELVRSIRDETWLDDPALLMPPTDTWDNLNSYTNNDFKVDYLNFAEEVVNTGDLTITDDPDTMLYLDSDGFYSHDNTGAPTRFYRIITISFSPDSDGDGVADYASVVSRVEWLNNGHPKNYITESLLYDWR